MKKIVVLLLSFLIIKESLGQFAYKVVPVGLTNSQNTVGVRDRSEEYKRKGYKLVDELPTGHVKDASVDYTKELQRGIDQHNIVVFPNFPVLVGDDGLSLRSNTIVVFDKNSQLVLTPNSKEWYEVLRLHGVENVSVYDANIIGDRERHQGKKGEWGMGIAIRGADNIKIINPKIERCWGDGIVMGIFEGNPATNVKIVNAQLDFNRRNGIAMGSVENIEIINPIVSNTEGTLPMSGICIEPNNNGEVCNNISIVGAVTFNNANAGIQIGLAKLPGKRSKNVNIVVRDHKDYGSKIGLHVGGFKHVTRQTNGLLGRISIENPSWNNNRNSIKTGNNYDVGPDIVITKMSIRNNEPYQQEQNVKKRLNAKHRKITIK